LGIFGTKEFPFFKQHDAMDCGATCLRMVARYYGRHYSLDMLRELTHVDREGVSLMSISDASEKLGFHTLGVRVDFKTLKAEAPLPAILHWNQKHFVVLYEVGADYVRIADPAVGKVKLHRDEFMQYWADTSGPSGPQGVALLFETTPEFFKREGQKVDRAGFGFLWTYIRKYRALLFQLFLGLLLGSILQVVFPFLMQAVVDKGVLTRDISFIWLVLIAQLVLFVSQVSVEFIRGWILLHIGSRVNISLVSDFLIKLMKLPMGFFDTKLTGDLLQRIYDNERVERFLTSSSLVTLFSAVSLVVFGCVLAMYSMTIFWVFMGAAVLYFVWITLFLRKRRDLNYQRFEQLSKNQSALIQLVNGMQEIKLHNAEKRNRWAWESIQARLFRINTSYLATDQLQRAGAMFINESKNILITFISAKAVVDGQMSLGMMLAVQYIIGQMNAPLDALVDFILQAQDARISLERMNEIHTKADEESLHDPKINVLPENGNLVLDNVSFQYGGPHSPWALQGVNAVIREGKTTAIVGTSGSGKTTLVKLLLQYYPPTSGTVRLGDISLTNVQTRLWRDACGVVMQDGYIFSDSIAHNIAIGERTVDRKKLIQAAKLANIQDFVESLPHGYNTIIGQEGMGLSQGQKQRLLIARAIYKNPEYLFFDEATNALDTTNERTIMDNLDQFLVGRTVVVVAHRLSTVRNADHIIVLHKGKIAEQGSHAELIDLRGIYFDLVRNQLELGV
jgi:ATP-binding cassette, subfamily B, bacterial